MTSHDRNFLHAGEQSGPNGPSQESSPQSTNGANDTSNTGEVGAAAGTTAVPAAAVAPHPPASHLGVSLQQDADHRRGLVPLTFLQDNPAKVDRDWDTVTANFSSKSAGKRAPTKTAAQSSQSRSKPKTNNQGNPKRRKIDDEVVSPVQSMEDGASDGDSTDDSDEEEDFTLVGGLRGLAQGRDGAKCGAAASDGCIEW